VRGELEEVMKMNIRLKQYIAIGIIAAITIFIIIWCIMYKGRKEQIGNTDEKTIDSISIEESKDYISIMEIADFENGVEIDKVQIRVYEGNDVAKVYRNNEFIGVTDMVYNNNKGNIDFKPEQKINSNNTLIDLLNYESGIGGTYNIDIKKTELYIANLIKEGDYKLKRRVSAQSYVEAYLLDTKDNVIRIIATSDKMIMGTLKEGITLRDILDYIDFIESEGMRYEG